MRQSRRHNALIWPAACIAIALLPLLSKAQTASADIVVAADGTGQYTSIQEAISDAPIGLADHWITIRVKPGIYHEMIYVQRERGHIRLVADDPDPANTVITYDLNAKMPGSDGKPIGTFRTPTVYIDADDFTAENITFSNSAGPVGQALALRVDGDRVAFRNCRFTGWQDTILDNRGRHYYDRCDITGAVDFIFGGGNAVYDHCTITQLRDKGGDLTAPSTPQGQQYGLTFLSCRLTGAEGVQPATTGLMRPWRPYGESTFIDCSMDASIKPEGWDTWSGREKTCRAYEYGSVSLADGKPVDISRRASWSHELSKADAANYTLKTIFQDWDPKAAE